MRANNRMKNALIVTLTLSGSMLLTGCGQPFSASNLQAQTVNGSPTDALKYPPIRPKKAKRAQPDQNAQRDIAQETAADSTAEPSEITELIERLEGEQHSTGEQKKDLEGTMPAQAQATESKPETIPTPKARPTSPKTLRPKPRPENLAPKKEEESSSKKEETNSTTSSDDKADVKTDDKASEAPQLRPKPRPSKGNSSELPVQVRGFWEETHSSGRQWTQITTEALEKYGKDLMNAEPSDAKYFCPKFKSLERDARMSFWVHLLSAIAIRESRLRPHVKYEEKFNDSSGDNVVSRGLLQISLESSRYYDCGIKTSKDLHDPEMNLNCGVRILNQWIPKDRVVQGKRGRVYLGAGRYWSVMRKGESLKWIRSQMNKLDFCQ